MNLNKKIRQELMNYGRGDWSEQALKETCAAAHDVYTQKKQGRRMGFGTFLLRQVRFTAGRVWMLQAGVLIALCLVLDLQLKTGSGSYSSLGFAFSLVSAVTAMTGIPYICRSARWGMYEMETASRVSFSGLLCARLAITGAGNLIMLAAFFTLAHLKLSMPLNTASYMLLPFFIVWMGVMLLVRRACDKFLPLYCGAFSILIIASLFGLHQLAPRAFGPDAAMLWNIVCIVIIAGLSIQIRALIKKPSHMDGVSV